ncbi:MAG TPA: twin-arginine translocation signal domain-containing protein, partial [Lacipirellulaceae bacterium]
MNVRYACNSAEHGIARRQFLGTLAAAGAGVMTGGLGVFSSPAIANQLRSDQKRIVVFNMHGGLSQLESWDPKPGTDTGGPFRAIPTSVPGVH